MNKEELLSKIKKSFVRVLEHNNFELNNTTTAEDVDGWESITHMLIMTDIEKSFNIKFKLMDLMSMENVGDLLNTVQKEIENQ
ncbi:acyl carrier protein [Algibacter luteus]|jgi:acyl carrier protein|uniref:Acyl carrier protein n=1 Tax=Algibacter luteus TaxID=1178825 RepID=A0A1M6BIX3_9FLAO|nr:acyl carrier protein [Algibacter luteus]WJJ95507.1 acyl carrier protein [Algibacter luteus]SHI48730.1 acyl carrier protein [Algibacter luteus]